MGTTKERFCEYVASNTNCSKTEAVKVFEYYKKYNLIKVDVATGGYYFKHGMLLDVSTLKECLKIIKGE